MDDQLLKLGLQAYLFEKFGGKEIVLKLLGPTADYLGGGVKTLTEKGAQNIARIFSIALRKLGSKVEESGAIPPKVLHRIIDEGFFCEDQLSAEYYGGVLASSRVSNLRDDRGVYWLSVVNRMTSYQLRAHYIIYMCLHAGSEKIDEVDAALNNQKALLTKSAEFLRALDLRQDDSSEMLTHVSAGLRREELLSGNVGFHKSSDELQFETTRNGALLLMWAAGFGKEPLAKFSLLSFPSYPDVVLPSSKRLVGIMRNQPRWG